MTFNIRHETLDDDYPITHILDSVFGPGRFAKTAYRLRETSNYQPLFGLVTENHLTHIVATIRIAFLPNAPQTVILGPIAVIPDLRNLGLGMALMKEAEAECRHYDINRIILIGDPLYYNRFGYHQNNAHDILLPGPVVKTRLLGKIIVN